jgi:phosphoribosylamine---glycine ligase
MKVLVVGNGGREHTLVWKLAQSADVERVFCAPGNAGTALEPKSQNLALEVLDFAGLAEFAQKEGVDLTVIGPEVPLCKGIVDYFQERGLLVFGPNQAGAQIEGSKSWAKEFMVRAKIPTAQSQTFTDFESAKSYVQLRLTQVRKLVIKADGLAAGKGVVIVQDLAEASSALESMFQGLFGSAGSVVVIEEFLEGQEASVLALCDGKTIVPLLAAQDHKTIGEGDQGPNTGGMGAYCPAPVVTAKTLAFTQQEVLDQALAEFQRRGIDYRGILYAGLMVHPDETVSVVEFNCRFGDPETQVVLPLLANPLEQVLIATAKGQLQFVPLQWHPESAVCVVIAAGGYPGPYCQGKEITGLGSQVAETVVFHAGTEEREGRILTKGGRVLGVTATAPTLKEAVDRAYQRCSFIQFEDAYYRKDIAHRVLKTL